MNDNINLQITLGNLINKPDYIKTINNSRTPL